MDGYAQLETSIIEKVGITAAALYALIKRRWQLSCANGSKWQDSKGVFCRMARKEMCALLHKSRPTITKAMRALRRAGLLSEKRVGLGATNKIYLHLQRHSQKENSVCTGGQVCIQANGKHISHGERPTRTRKNQLLRAPAATGYAQHTYAPGELDHVYTDIMHGEID